MKQIELWLIRILAFGALLLVLLYPMGSASAKTCYDASKNPIPCQKSDYLLTQEAKKQAGPSSTPVPDTATFTPVPPTATDTPVPASATPTASPTSTSTSVPVVGAALPAAPPAAPEAPKPTGGLPLIWIVLVAAGVIVLGGIGIRRARRIPRASGQKGSGQGLHLAEAVVKSDGAPGSAPASSGDSSAIDHTVPVQVGWMDVEHPLNPNQRGSYDIDGVSSRGMGTARDPVTGERTGSWGSWIDRDGKEHTLNPDDGNAFVKKGYGAASENPGADLSQADIDASRAKVAALADPIAIPFSDREQNVINTEANREGRDVGQKVGAGIPGDSDPESFGHETGHSSTGSRDDNSGTSSDNSNDGKDKPKASSGDGTSGTEGDSGKDKPKGGDDGGKSDGSDSSDEKPDKPKGGDDSMGTPDGAGGDGNSGMRPGMFSGGPGGSSPDGQFERAGRPGGTGTPGDSGTGSGTGGEGGLDTNTGGQVGGLRPGAGSGRLAPSEGVGTNTGDPVA